MTYKPITTQWIPQTPPPTKKVNTTKKNTSLLAGFSSVVCVDPKEAKV